MAIVNFKTGKELSAKEIKAGAMRALGLNPNSREDTRTYQKEYDKFRNKVRNYETISGRSASGAKPLKVNELFYEQAKAKQRYGSSYKPSGLLKAIDVAPSTSTGKIKVKTQDGKKTLAGVSKAKQRAIAREIRKQFVPLRQVRKSARAAIKGIDKDNPLEVYKALTDYAKQLQEARKNAYDQWRVTHPRGQYKATDFDWYSTEISANIE